jgi:hypothetical protein
VTVVKVVVIATVVTVVTGLREGEDDWAKQLTERATANIYTSTYVCM